MTLPGKTPVSFIPYVHTASGDIVLGGVEFEAVKNVAREARDVAAGVSNDHKDIHASISKFGRTIDKVRPLHAMNSPLVHASNEANIPPQCRA